ncbi:hypothetical protein [Streptomyces sp. HUAS TT3]
MERPYEVDACQLLAVWALVVAAGFVLELPVQAAGGTARPCSAVAPAQV